MKLRPVTHRSILRSVAVLLPLAALAANSPADYIYDSSTTVVGHYYLLPNEQFILENGAVISGIGPTSFTSNRPDDQGPGFVLKSGTLQSITLSGSTSAMITGPGVVSLDTAQGYTGSTTISEGTLQLSVDNALTASASLLLENSGTLAIGPTSQHVQALVIGNGFLTGGPTATLSSQNGFLVAEGASTVTLGDSTLPYAAPASLTKIASGTFTLQAQNTYTGATNILEGTLQTDAYAISDASAVRMTSDATWDMTAGNQTVGSLRDAWYGPPGSAPISGATVLIAENSLGVGFDDSNATFTGEIIGSGTGGHLFKTGIGSWTLNGTASNLHTLTVDEGSLFINNIIDAETVDVTGLAFTSPLLGGLGKINTELLSVTSSALMPGTWATPGRLTISADLGRSGDLLTDADTLLYFRLGSSYSNYAQIVAEGHAALGGSLVVTPWFGFRPTFRTSYTLVRAENGITNQLDHVHTFFRRTMLKPRVRQIDYSDGSSELRLTFEQQRFSGVRRISGNQRSLASSLDKEFKSGNLTPLIDTLNLVDIEHIPALMALLSPEQVSAAFSMGFSGSKAQVSNIEGRLDTARAGNSGFSASGLILSDSRGSLHTTGGPIMRDDLALSLAGFEGESLLGKATVLPIDIESRWGFFITGSGQWADIESTKLARGSEFTTGGVTIGADYRVNNNLIVGLAGGYANTASDLWNDGRVSLNSGRGNVYASLYNENAYLNTSVGGAYNSFETRRTTLGGSAKAKPNGGGFDAMLGGGYDIHLNNGFTFGPIASLQYAHIGLNSYREYGSDAPMAFPNQSQDSLRSSIGLRGAYALEIGGIVITPEVRLQWAHEYLDSTAAVVSRFVGASSTFTVLGPEIGRDSLVLDAGVSAQVTSNVGIFAYYTGEIGRTNYSSNSINGGFRISF